MLNTLLFDLDGTLLPMDNDHFTKGYFKHLIPRVMHLIDQDKFIKQLWASTEAMVRSDDASRTNEQVFKEDFLGKSGIREEEIWPILVDFYQGEFHQLSHLTSPTPLARKAVETAMEKGYSVVLATNPLFPRAAIEARMKWANIEDLPFELVTTLEEMHFCKPNLSYYKEILQKIGRKPDECMMIGNDGFEDMIAGKLGMQTYLVTDCLIERNLLSDPIHQQGTMENLLEFIKGLPDLKGARVV
ncbi:HAD family hydrolase [Effusibacillus lacus]|uniref:Hydrolase n=1 Tax=Effusibacillus lacus TaxID=1348429 RepID=A0A292YSQ8_9BACL|nr:HAD family hydrolase [Effusibacillus lacus]TCS73546.1 FMN phosphatase YigB (HAD superfamily) [Effusibacillus lacus]GAX91959.1 hydrolase [Effusibacillus lacus]